MLVEESHSKKNIINENLAEKYCEVKPWTVCHLSVCDKLLCFQAFISLPS